MADISKDRFTSESIGEIQNENRELKKRLREVELQLDINENEKYTLRKKVNEVIWSKTKFLVNRNTFNKTMDFWANEGNVPDDIKSRWKLMTEPIVRKCLNAKRNTLSQSLKKFFMSK